MCGDVYRLCVDSACIGSVGVGSVGVGSVDGLGLCVGSVCIGSVYRQCVQAAFYTAYGAPVAACTTLHIHP